MLFKFIVVLKFLRVDIDDVVSSRNGEFGSIGAEDAAHDFTDFCGRYTEFHIIARSIENYSSSVLTSYNQKFSFGTEVYGCDITRSEQADTARSYVVSCLRLFYKHMLITS